VTDPKATRQGPEPTPLALSLLDALVRGNAAILADLRDMAEGNYTGRYSQAFLDGEQP
jgi:hypothetical protein